MVLKVNLVFLQRIVFLRLLGLHLHFGLIFLCLVLEFGLRKLHFSLNFDHFRVLRGILRRRLLFGLFHLHHLRRLRVGEMQIGIFDPHRGR